jgi:hypothetical protein
LAVGTVAAAPPAAAHSVSGISSSNWVTRILSVTPSLPGLTVKVVQLGNYIELANRGPEVMVLGYEGEPYLRVGPGGVFENLRSPATYLNRTRQGTTPIPPVASDEADTPPIWHRISGGHTVVFHDHRTHWMGGVLPAPVRTDPHRTFQLKPNWHIQLRQGPVQATVTGSLTWVPGPNPAPSILGAAALAALTMLIIRSKHWALLLPLALALLVTSDLVHTVAIASTAVGGVGAQALAWLRGSFYSFAGWIFAAVAIRNLRRRGSGGFLAAIFAGTCVFILTGLADFATLYRSQAPFAWGIWLDRATIMIALGVGLGVVVTAFCIGRRFLEGADELPFHIAEIDEAEQWPQLRLLPPPDPPPTLS